MITRSLFGILLLIFPAIAACNPLDHPRDRVAIRVGDEEITKKRLEQDLGRLARDLELKDEEIDACMDRMVDQLVERYLILAHGKDNGIRLDQGEVAAAVKEVKEDYYSEAQFKKMLLEYYVDLEEWRDRLKEQLLVEKIVSRHLEKVPPVSHKEIQAYYENNLDLFRYPEMILFMQMVTKYKKQAEGIMEDLKSGTSMEELMDELQGSEPGIVCTRPRWAGREELGEALSGEIFSMEPGGPPRMIQTQYGYHLVKILDKRPAGVRRLPDVMEDIEKRLSSENKERFFEQWMEELRKRYPVSINREVIETLRTG